MQHYPGIKKIGSGCSFWVKCCFLAGLSQFTEYFRIKCKHPGSLSFTSPLLFAHMLFSNMPPLEALTGGKLLKPTLYDISRAHLLWFTSHALQCMWCMCHCQEGDEATRTCVHFRLKTMYGTQDASDVRLQHYTQKLGEGWVRTQGRVYFLQDHVVTETMIKGRKSQEHLGRVAQQHLLVPDSKISWLLPGS